MTANLENPIFTDTDKAREFLEAVRWPNGPICPHCGSVEGNHRLEGKASRPGLYQCNACHGQFSVTVGTVFERSKIKLNIWLLATHLLTSSKKGMSSHQIHRMLGVTYKTAWFMTHRIREAMKTGTLGPMGGQGGFVEVDETFIGQREDTPKRRGHHHKRKVLSLVDRNTGQARSVVVDSLTAKAIGPILKANIARDSILMTDEAGQYQKLGKEFAYHFFVRHADDQYVSGLDPKVHTNTIEGFFSIFKRGMKGVYQHCGERHLHRYLAEFDFRYNNRTALGVDDEQRATRALKGIEGKRLTYRRTGSRAN